MSSLITILISAGVSLVTALVTFQTRVWGDTLLLRKQHEWDQRKKLTKLVGRYHARLLEAAVDWDRRMSQAYAGEYRWLKFDGADIHRSQDQYFFHSMVFRFLNLLIAARSFEREAVFIDARISDEQKELDFLRFVKSFFWATTNSDLTPRDDMPGRDHFANDAFRALLDHSADSGSGTDDERHPFTWTRYWELVRDAVVPFPRSDGDGAGGDPSTSLVDQRRSIGVLLDFFLGMAPHEAREPGKEPRRRWDRMVCLHLLTLGFIASFGYD
ncbi:hypothetical protein [Actinomycetospora sp. TBRC 11914]|uniref:hypothetical protein n=1 Tax=Actinomycetospora sp. TBRC 11914 TaxID=2729387 RepID=UPI00145D296A|nr:hypothetical protein [Actinomycetospora sp. TBRC 11914]NMO91203.1 hypothetical protein [Actinomycetospora sp. TBRC 11914]